MKWHNISITFNRATKHINIQDGSKKYIRMIDMALICQQKQKLVLYISFDKDLLAVKIPKEYDLVRCTKIIAAFKFLHSTCTGCLKKGAKNIA